MYRYLLIFSLLLAASQTWGQEAFLWRQSPSSQAFLLAKKPHQTEAQALDEYFQKLSSEKRLAPLIETEELAHLREGQSLRYEYGELSSLPQKGRKPRFIVVTNEVND